jgi:hypothetical protein
MTKSRRVLKNGVFWVVTAGGSTSDPRRNNPEDNQLNRNRRENLKSYRRVLV